MKYVKYAISALVLCAAFACTKNPAKETLPEINNLVVTASSEISVAAVSFQQRYVPGANVQDATVGVEIVCTEEGTTIKSLKQEFICIPGTRTYSTTFSPLASETGYKVRAFLKLADADTTFGQFVNLTTAALEAAVQADTTAVSDTAATLNAAIEYANSADLPTEVTFYLAEGAKDEATLLADGAQIKGSVSSRAAKASTYDAKKAESKLKPATEYSFVAVAKVSDAAVEGLADANKKSVTEKSAVFTFTTLPAAVQD